MEIHKIAIIGAGIMGHGISQVISMAGVPVNLVDINEDFLKKAKLSIDSSLDRMLKKGGITLQDKNRIAERISCYTDLKEAVKDADLVIEAVPENIELKKNLFQKLDKFTKPEAILATNTSQYSITDIASVVSKSSRVLGMHWFNPPVIMKLIEIVRGLETSEEVIEQIRNLAGKVGKEVVVCKDSQGFITTRVLLAMRLECYRVFEEGVASKEDIDKALKLALGHPMGQFELADFSGLDIEPPACEALTKSFGDRFRAPQTLLNLVRAGRLGRKTGKGWYNYADSKGYSRTTGH